MRKKILKVFFVILTGITVTLTGCELSGSNESAQTESESGKDAVKFIPNLNYGCYQEANAHSCGSKSRRQCAESTVWK